MTDIVLDASALLAMLKAEPGGSKIAETIAESRISAVNDSEIVSHFIHAGMPPLAVEAMLSPLPVRMMEANAALTSAAGRLRAVTSAAGLSIGDRFCLALARRDNLPAWTADRAWQTIAPAAGATVFLIR